MINYLESGVGSESEHEGSGSKGEEDSDGENNMPSPTSMVTTLTNSHNEQSSCNTKVRMISFVHTAYHMYKYVFIYLLRYFYKMYL